MLTALKKINFNYLLSITAIVLSLIAFNLSTKISLAAVEEGAGIVVGNGLDIEKCAEALSDYMNTVLLEIGDTSHVKVTSPIFNLTNPIEQQIYVLMRDDYNAQFGQLDAMAGNAYNVNGNTPVGYLTSFGITEGIPFIFGEFGTFENVGGQVPDIKDSAARAITDNMQPYLDGMKSDFSQIYQSPKTVLGAAYFNALGTGNNSEFGFHVITGPAGGAPPSNDVLNAITGDLSQKGVNSANFVDTNGGFFNKARDYFQDDNFWMVEIISGERGDLAGYINSLPSETDIFIRLCIGDSCGFEDPLTLASFIKRLDSELTRDMYIALGPNEPATEHWVSPYCGSESQDRQWEWKFWDCSAEENPEYHSLRPYPAGAIDPAGVACGNTPDYMAFCANTLVAKESFKLDYEEDSADASSCEEKEVKKKITWTTEHYDPLTGLEFQLDHEDNITYNDYLCYNTPIYSKVALELDLLDAELPVLGNTEDVPNSESATGIGIPTRMNEYVSWYLQGGYQTAEEEFQDPSDPEMINRLINYSGPLQKALPLSEEIYSIIRQNRARAHNQIVVCTDGFPEACYEDSSQNRRRFNEVASRPFSREYAYIPYTSTEDEIGYINIQTSSIQPPLGVGENKVVGFTESPKVLPENYVAEDPNLIVNASEDIFYAHALESEQGAKMLQQTYAPGGFPLTSTERMPPVEEAEGLSSTPYCVITETFSNPGDNLYGWVDVPEDPGHAAANVDVKTDYNALVDCLFETQFDEGKYIGCRKNGGGVEGCKLEAIGDSICNTGAYAAIKFDVQHPWLKNIFNRLVYGTMSVFRRFYPRLYANNKTLPEEQQITVPGPENLIKDVPGVTYFSVAATNIESSVENTGTSGVTSQGFNNSGDFTSNRGELYFPYLGTIHQHFLKDLQCTFRPAGVGCDATIDVREMAEDRLEDCTEYTAEQLAEVLPPIDASCTGSCSSYSFDSPSMKLIFESAASAFNVPVDVLLGVFYNEGGLNNAWDEERVLLASGPGCKVENCQDNVSRTGAQGPWQFVSSSWSINSDSVRIAGINDTRTPNVCNLVDSTFAAARTLSVGRGGAASYEPPYDLYPYCAGGVTYNTAFGPSTSCNWTRSDVVTAARQYLGYCEEPDRTEQYFPPRPSCINNPATCYQRSVLNFCGNY